jgi:hypothetical protein
MNIIKPKSAVKAAFVAAAMLATPAAILGVSVPSASASAGQATLMPGEVLSGGQSLIDGPYTMAMQTDGNFVLYANGNQALWQSHTYNNPGSDVAMQTDGNLVVYSSGGQALWQSGTYNQPGDHLVVQTDGNAVIYTPSSRAAWATNTAQPAATSVSAGTATADAGTQCWKTYHNLTVAMNPVYAGSLGPVGGVLSGVNLGVLHMQADVCANGTSAWITSNGGQPQCWTDDKITGTTQVWGCSVQPWGNGIQVSAEMKTVAMPAYVIPVNLETFDWLNLYVSPGAASEPSAFASSSTWWATTYLDCNNNFCPVIG